MWHLGASDHGLLHEVSLTLLRVTGNYCRNTKTNTHEKRTNLYGIKMLGVNRLFYRCNCCICESDFLHMTFYLESSFKNYRCLFSHALLKSKVGIGKCQFPT